MNQSRRRAVLVAVLSVTFGIGLPIHAHSGANADLKTGYDCLTLKNYKDALEIFNQLAREHPDMAEPHFGRARALEGLNRRQEAVTEFRLCLLLNPPQTISEQCNHELDYLTLKPQRDCTPPTITEKDVEQTSTRITNQASDRIRLIQRQSGALLAEGYFAAQNPGWRYRLPPSGGRRPAASGPDLYRLQDGRRRYTSGRQYSDQRCNAIRECAEGLRLSMSTKPSEYSGVYLSPHGTNLYVRNYINFDAKKPEVIEPMQAVPLTYADLKSKKNQPSLQTNGSQP